MKGNELAKTTIEDLGEIKIVGFRVLCEGDQYINEIPKAAIQLNERMDEIQHVTDLSIQYGAFIIDNYSEDEDGYWIGVQVKEYENIPEGMGFLTIPPQRYAVWKHTGANDAIIDSYTRLHKWIEDNGYERQLDKWHLERYRSWSNKWDLSVDLLDTVRKS